MTAPLYDIKAKFSEYVTMAENGEVVEITKHGTTTAVIISLKMFNELNDEYQELHKPSFVEQVRKWRLKNKDILDNDFADILEKQHQEDRKEFDERSNPWL